MADKFSEMIARRTRDVEAAEAEQKQRALAAVLPAVLAQGLGQALVPGERVLEAAFAASLEGRGMAIVSMATRQALVIVTDRRIVKVAAWQKPDWLEAMGACDRDLDSTMDKWASGTLLDARHQLTRRYLWLGEMREAAICPERWPRTEALFLTRFDGSRVRVRAHLPVLRRLDAAVRVGLTGPGRWALPPERPRPRRRVGA